MLRDRKIKSFTPYLVMILQSVYFSILKIESRELYHADSCEYPIIKLKIRAH
jgi:hypothetical protein